MPGVDLGTAVGYLLLDTSGFTSGFSTARSALKTFQDESATAADKISAIGSAASSVGGTLTRNLTLPLAGIGTAIMKVGNDFEAQMSRVEAISGATAEEMERLNETALELGSSTSFSASEAAEGMENLASAGFTANEIISAMPGLLDLAASSGADLATATDYAASTLRGFGLEADQAGHVADVFAEAAARTNAQTEDMGEAMKYIAPVAKAMGQSLEETAAAVGILADAGIKGSQAGTTLRGALSRLAKPTEQMTKTMDQLGLEFYDMQGNMLPLNGIIAELETNMAGLTQEQRNQALVTLFGQESLSGMLALMDRGSGTLRDMTASFHDVDGAAAEMADTMMDNTSGAIEEMMGAIETLAIRLQQVMAPVITDIVQKITEFINWLGSLDEETLKTVVSIAGFAAALGPVLAIVGKIASGIGSLINVFSKFSGALTGAFSTISQVVGSLTGTLTGPLTGAASTITKIISSIASLAPTILPIVAIIGTLIAAFKTLWDTNEQFRDSITGIWESITGAFSDFADGIVQRINELGFNFESLGEIISSVWEGITSVLAPVFTGVFEQIAIVIQTILDTILNIMDIFIGLFTGDWEQMTQGIYSLFSGLANGIVATLQNILTTIGGVIDAILGLFGTSLEDVWNGLVTGVTNAAEAIGNGVQSIIDWFVALPGNISGAVSSAINAVGNFASSVTSTLSNGIGAAIDGVGNFFSQLPEKIGYGLGYAIGTIQNWLEEIWNTVSTQLPIILNDIGNWFAQLPANIWNWLTQTLSAIGQWFSNLWTQLTGWFSQTFAMIGQWLSQLPAAVAEWLNGVFTTITEWGANLITTIGEIMGGFFQSIVDWLSQIPQAFADWFQSVIDFLASLPERLFEIGASILQSLWDGMMSIADGLFGWIGDIVDAIASMFSAADQGYEDARSKASSVSGSYASGLDYVPRDMNVRVHEGERILTKQENTSGAFGNSYNGPETLKFDLSIPLDGQILARKQYTYNLREGTLRGDDLVLGGGSL